MVFILSSFRIEHWNRLSGQVLLQMPKPGTLMTEVPAVKKKVSKELMA